MSHRIFRQVRSAAAGLLVALSLLGCSPAQYPLEPSVAVAPAVGAPTAKDYCPQVIYAIDNLDELLMQMAESDDRSLMPEAAIAARKVALILLTAEYDGVEIDSVEDVWFIRAHEAARVFFTIAEGPEDEYSEDELAEALEDVFGWLHNARRECGGSFAYERRSVL